MSDILRRIRQKLRQKFETKVTIIILKLNLNVYQRPPWARLHEGIQYEPSRNNASLSAE